VIPGLVMLRGYRRSWLNGDLAAGVTVAAYLIPQVMAYATLAGLPAFTGLWARWFVLNVEANVEVDFTALRGMGSFEAGPAFAELL
jgi:hypothetical protein